MKWEKYRLKTTTSAVDMISYTLGEMGIEGIEIEDKLQISEEDKKKMFIDILPELGEDDGIAYVSFYIEPERDTPEYLQEIFGEIRALEDFVEIGEVTIEKSETEDVDWVNNWKKFWKPFKVDEHIMIKPTWETLPEGTGDEMLVIEMDPGTSFGTGMHHTTRLCIQQMRKFLEPGQQLFDVGCGSGILSIIGLKLGAQAATATDIDENAVKAAIENAGVNHIDMSTYKVMTGDIVTDGDFREVCGREKFDIVTANILADIIIPLSAVIKENMKPGGIFISSGIINTKEAAVREALLADQFEIVEVSHSGDWVAFTARKPA